METNFESYIEKAGIEYGLTENIISEPVITTLSIPVEESIESESSRAITTVVVETTISASTGTTPQMIVKHKIVGVSNAAAIKSTVIGQDLRKRTTRNGSFGLVNLNPASFVISTKDLKVGKVFEAKAPITTTQFWQAKAVVSIVGSSGNIARDESETEILLFNKKGDPYPYYNDPYSYIENSEPESTILPYLPPGDPRRTQRDSNLREKYIKWYEDKFNVKLNWKNFTYIIFNLLPMVETMIIVTSFLYQKRSIKQ